MQELTLLLVETSLCGGRRPLPGMFFKDELDARKKFIKVKALYQTQTMCPGEKVEGDRSKLGRNQGEQAHINSIHKIY